MQALLAMHALGRKKVFIVVKKTLRKVWVREIRKWLGDVTVQEVNGVKMAREVRLRMEEAQYWVISYDHFKRHVNTLMKANIDGFIFDEAHVLKERDTKVTEAVWKVTKAYRLVPCYLLTGTPILNRPDEIYSLLHILSPFEFASYWNFVDTYIGSEEKFIGGRLQKVPKRECLSTLTELLKAFILRRLKSEVLTELPAKTFETIEVELEGEQRKLYETMRDELYAAISEDLEINATVVIAQITRLKQIAVSHNLLNKSDDRLEGAKIDALFELLDDVGDQKVVIFSQFADAIKRLSTTMRLRGIDHEVLIGETKENDRQDGVDRFQTDPGCKVFLASIQAGGVGITLTAATVAVFLDLYWTPAINAQAEDRLHRIGQHNPVTIYSIEAEETIEAWILSLLDEKRQIFNELIPVNHVVPELVKAIRREEAPL